MFLVINNVELELVSMKNENNHLLKIILLISYILFNICIILLSTIIVNSNNKNWILQYVIVSLIQISISIIYLKRAGEDLFSLSMIFIIFTYIFYFGQLFMYAFKIKNNSDYDVVAWIALDTLKKACTFTSISIFFLTLGIIIIWFQNKKLNNDNDENENDIENDIENKKKLKIIFKIGLVLFCISIVPKLYWEISRFRLHAMGGYLATYNVLNFSGGGVLVTFANMVEYSVVIMLIGLQDKKATCKFIFLSSLIFEVMLMLSGNRSRAVMSILMYLYIYIKLIKKIKMKDIIIISLCGYIGLSLITFISRTRMQLNMDIDSLLNEFTYSFFQHSPIFDSLAEFGSTMVTLCFTIQIFSEYGKPTYGINYIFSFFNAIPNINGIVEPFRNAFEYTTSNIFQAFFGNIALGGSFLGELYYNFNYFGAFFAIIIGLIVGFVSKNLHYTIKDKNWLKLSILMILFPNILWLVRNYFSGLVRDFIWTSIVILIISFFVKDRKRDKILLGIKYNKTQ